MRIRMNCFIIKYVVNNEVVKPDDLNKTLIYVIFQRIDLSPLHDNESEKLSCENILMLNTCNDVIE